MNLKKKLTAQRQNFWNEIFFKERPLPMPRASTKWHTRTTTNSTLCGPDISLWCVSTRNHLVASLIYWRNSKFVSFLAKIYNFKVCTIFLLCNMYFILFGHLVHVLDWSVDGAYANCTPSQFGELCFLVESTEYLSS